MSNMADLGLRYKIWPAARPLDLLLTIRVKLLFLAASSIYNKA